MGIDYYTCEKCKDPVTMYDGRTLWKCKNRCESWVCYRCMDNANAEHGDECDEEPVLDSCIICQAEDDKKNSYKEHIQVIEDELNDTKLSSRRKKKLMKLIKSIPC